MKNRISQICGTLLLAAFATTTASAALIFTPLGDLPGGIVRSYAYGASADGSVIVGFGTSAAGQEGYRWTRETGMVNIGGRTAYEVSADGSMTVGDMTAGSQGFRWTATAGLVGQGYLQQQSVTRRFGRWIRHCRSLKLHFRAAPGYRGFPLDKHGWDGRLGRPSRGARQQCSNGRFT
jgi:hypothetical protein